MLQRLQATSRSPLNCIKRQYVSSNTFQLRHSWRASTTASAFLLSNGVDVAKHAVLAKTPVLRVSDAANMTVTDAWGSNEMCVVVFARSFGCPFCQCAALDHTIRIPRVDLSA